MLAITSKNKTYSYLLFFFCLAAIHCGSEATDTGENFGDITDSPDSLVLTEEEHIYGWGRDDCTMCHNLNNIHLVDRTGIGLNMEDIQDITFEDGEDSCATCHGNNGT
jgi:hypothetical protein